MGGKRARSVRGDQCASHAGDREWLLTILDSFR